MAGGTGISTDPYLIATVAEFYAIPTMTTSHYRQVANIDFTGRTTSHLIDFNGVYDGGGYKFKNLNTSSPSFMFFTVAGLVKNIEIDATCSMIYQGSSDAAAFSATTASTGTFVNCINRGSMKTDGNALTRTAGIAVVSPTAGDRIVNCKNYGDIDAYAYAMGIGFSGSQSTFRNCENHGVINARTGNAAGIGMASSDKIYIEDCINYGEVISPGMSAGITLGDSVDITVRRCINVGVITGGTEGAGIISGWLGSTVIACVALNPTIYIKGGNSGANFNRISSRVLTTAPANCYALDTMELRRI